MPRDALAPAATPAKSEEVATSRLSAPTKLPTLAVPIGEDMPRLEPRPIPPIPVPMPMPPMPAPDEPPRPVEPNPERPLVPIDDPNMLEFLAPELVADLT